MELSTNSLRLHCCQNSNKRCSESASAERTFNVRSVVPESSHLYKGFSFVEVMISLFILAIGVLGAVGMHLAALRMTQQSIYQTAAIQLASDAADVIRANALRGAGKGKPSAFSDMDYQSAVDSEPAAPSRLCHVDACNADELAEFEMYEWRRRVKSALPNGRIRICHDAHAWDSAKEALTWECDGGRDADSPLVIKLGWQAKNPDGSLAADKAGRFPPGVALFVNPA